MRDFEREQNENFVESKKEVDGAFATNVGQDEHIMSNSNSGKAEDRNTSSETVTNAVSDIPLSQENIPSRAEANIIIDTAVDDEKLNSDNKSVLYTYSKKDLGSNAIDSFHSTSGSDKNSSNMNSDNNNTSNSSKSYYAQGNSSTQNAYTNSNNYQSSVYGTHAYNSGVNAAQEARRNGSSIPYSEYIKSKDKKKKEKRPKRYIAALLAGAVLNLAILGGAFALGHNFGKDYGKSDTKASLSESLKDDSGNSTSDSGTTGTTGTNGATGTASTNNSGSMKTIEVAKEVGPAVVGIKSKVQGQVSLFGGYSTSESQGSGIIISGDGYIVTNNHVVANSTAISVLLNTGSEYQATVVGMDDQTDLAIVKIEPKEDLTVANLGDSSKIEVGETAIAIGNPMGVEFFGSVTQGIVSAVNRTVEVDNRTMNLIQTDAAINSGNSGGALVNDRAEVIGINAVKVSTSGVEGMGFAIPISEAKPIMSDLLDYGYVKGRPVIGLSTRDVSSYMAQQYGWPQGAQIMSITTQNAKDAGLQQGDIITAVDGTAISSGSDLTSYKDTKSPGDTIELDVYKYASGNSEKVKVVLSEQIPD